MAIETYDETLTRAETVQLNKKRHRIYSSSEWALLAMIHSFASYAVNTAIQPEQNLTGTRSRME